MKTLHFLTSACRYCRNYKPEGRRGGMCQQLGVPVRGRWKACALALPPFAPAWESLEGIMMWSNDTPMLPASRPLVSALTDAQPESEQTFGCTPKAREPVLR